jgi:hypothetical protein
MLYSAAPPVEMILRETLYYETNPRSASKQKSGKKIRVVFCTHPNPLPARS